MERLREYRFCNIKSFSRPRRAHRWSSKDMWSFSPQKSVPPIDLIKGWLLIQYIMEGIIHPRSNSRASWRAAKGVLLTGGMVRVLSRWCHASRVVGKVAARCCRARRRRYWTSYFVLKRSTPATMRNSVWEGGGSKYLGRVRINTNCGTVVWAWLTLSWILRSRKSAHPSLNRKFAQPDNCRE